MFAIVRTGGKQYRVAAGDKIAVEKIPGEAGDSVTLGDVLLAGEGGDVKAAGDLKVAAEIIAQAKGEKVVVFKKRRRHNYRRKAGHRQQYTILRITAIGDQKAEDKAPAKAAAKAPAPAAAAAAAAPTDEPAAAPKNARKPKAGAGADKADKADKGADKDRLVPQDEPVKAEPTESPLVDAPKPAEPDPQA